MQVLRRLHPETVVTLPYGRAVVDLRDRGVSWRLYLNHEYEPSLQSLFERMDLRGRTCVDIGANTGVHTLFLSRAVGPSGKVFAFEPDPRNARLLDKTLRLNAADNVILQRCAIGDREGTGWITAVRPRNWAQHRITETRPLDRRAERVPMTTGYTALARAAPGAIALIKIDVEGYERHVLQGLRATLALNPSAVITAEIFPAALSEAGSSAQALVELFRELELDGYEFSDHRIMPLQDSSTYAWMTGSVVDVVLSRERGRLEKLVAGWGGSRTVDTQPRARRMRRRMRSS